MARNNSRGQGNVPHENHDGSRSFKAFRKSARRKIPEALFARPVDDADIEDPVERVKQIQRRKALATQRLVKRNNRLAIIIAATHSVGFLTPIWVIFGTDHLKLSLLASLILGSTGWVTSSLFELPMGAFADKYGRQISLVAGLGLCAIGDLSLIVFHNFWLLMAFQTLAGVGFALRSGSLEGLLHDTYEAQGATTAYAKLSSQMLFLLNASRILTIPLGTWLYNLQIDASLSRFTFPYVANVASLCIALVCASLLIEKRSSNKKLDSIAAGHVTGRLTGHVKDTWRDMMANRDVKRVLALLGLYAFIGEGNWVLYQSYFRERDIQLTESGWVYVFLAIFMTLGSRYVAIVYKKINVMWAMNFIIALVAFNIIVMHLPVVLAAPAFALNAFVGPMCWYLQDNAIQNRMVGDRKTTALSIASMTYNVGAMLGLYGIGAVAERIGVLHAQWLFVVYGVIVCVGMGFWCASDGLAVRPEDARATGLVVDVGEEESEEVVDGKQESADDDADDDSDDSIDEGIIPFDDVPQLKP